MIVEKAPTPHVFPYHPAKGTGIPVRREDEEGLLIIPYGHPRNRVFEGWRDTGLVLA